LVIDNFAGGGGASTGIEAALGRPVDIAINHSPAAIAMHAANHPETKHFCENIWEVDPVLACGGRPVGLAWFSPDCTHFSKAKGSQPLKKEIRGLAWVVIRWARAVQPRVIVLENVEEFQTWGPLAEGGRPDPASAGADFRAWLAQLRGCGYEVEFTLLTAADYGTPTTRRRLFLVARRDRSPIVWPTATHGPGRPAGGWRAAAEIIYWSLPSPSIFERRRPLAEATLKRIAAGIRRYVVEADDPFIIPVTHQGDERVHGIDEPVRTITGAHRGELALIDPFLPLGTVTGRDHHALTAAFLTKFYGTSIGSSPAAPMPTVTSGGNRGGGHIAEVRAFLTKFYSAGGDGRGQNMSLFDPLHTLTTKARFGLVTIAGEQYQIADIGMRMLQPHELFAAQGFPDDYEIRPFHNGKPLTKTNQTMLAGNSVCPQVAEAIVAANARKAA
jgi:DNA (cytosine-5)-methyltransferase 1